MIKSGSALLRRRTICSRSRKSYSRFLGAITFSQPAALSFARTCCPRNPPPPVTRTVLFVQNPISSGNHRSQSGVQVIGDAVIPLMPRTTLLTQNPGAFTRRSKFKRLHVSIHHDAHQVTKINFGAPSEFTLGFLRVGEQKVDFSRPFVAIIN